MERSRRSIATGLAGSTRIRCFCRRMLRHRPPLGEVLQRHDGGAVYGFYVNGELVPCGVALPTLFSEQNPVRGPITYADFLCHLFDGIASFA